MDKLKEIVESVHFVNELWVFIIPCVLMAVDVATGTLNAWKNNDLKSYKMREGLVKKCGEIIILGIGELFSVGMILPVYVMGGVSLYVIFMEAVSICENLHKMGVPIPAFISKVLSNAKNELEGKVKNDESGDSDR